MLLRNRHWPRPLTWLGAISYSVYVVHIPVLWSVFWLEKHVHFAQHGAAKFVPALIFLAGVLVFSQLTYKLIEMPGQNLGKKVAKALDRRLPQTGPKLAGEQAEAAAEAPNRQRRHVRGRPGIHRAGLSRHQAQTRRRAVAQRVSSCRLLSWSLRSTAETWLSTVFTEMKSCLAISLYA